MFYVNCCYNCNISANNLEYAFAKSKILDIIISSINTEDDYMKSILEELFYGNVCPNTDCRSTDKETKELMRYIADHHDALMAELNDKQRETFEKFDDCWDELTDINEREIFVYAFKLGMRIAIEVLSSDID